LNDYFWSIRNRRNRFRGGNSKVLIHKILRKDSPSSFDLSAPHSIL